MATSFEKFEIANGVWWIEIPGAEMKILCGCPADTVKHLRRKGLIVSKQTAAVSYETGPNAVLLADTPIQNGRFTNLAEFPVLQMLYRQGLILPGHPNNKGIKPMLIGGEDTVRSQSEYIYRGNYGLASEKELRAAGADVQTAGELFRLKRRFAFDHIRKTDELLDLRIVDKDAVELRNGVFVHRLAVNVFEILWNGHSVTVDLNLDASETYTTSYSLDMHEINNEYFSVIHTGEGDGWDVNRPCMASILTFQNRIYLIDAGPNIVMSLTALGISVNDVDGVFHTHCHDDHFSGLTTLIRSDHRITYYATPLVRASVMKKLSALMAISNEQELGKYFEFVDLVPDVWNDLEGLEVRPVYSPHPVETSIMFFRAPWKDGYKTYGHLADIASFDVLRNMISDDLKQSGITQEYFDSTEKVYLEPVDLKKVDIGGGMIHGRAEDFESDRSTKILLSHTERDLTPSERAIGSNAHFGMQDVLIPCHQDSSIQAAAEHLQAFFPDVPIHQIQMLLNYPHESFNAGTILIKHGSRHPSVYLVVRGVVEFIDPEDRRTYTLSAGSILGEYMSLMQKPAFGTFRAVSYVKTLEIPVSVYAEIFIATNSMTMSRNCSTSVDFCIARGSSVSSSPTPSSTVSPSSCKPKSVRKAHRFRPDRTHSCCLPTVKSPSHPEKE